MSVSKNLFLADLKLRILSTFSKSLSTRNLFKVLCVVLNKFKDEFELVLRKQSSGGAEIGVLKNFAKFTRKHLCRILFFK